MTKAQAKSLAVRYHAFYEAVNADDLHGIIVWGPMLAEIQAATRLEMIKASTIDNLVAAARHTCRRAA